MWQPICQPNFTLQNDLTPAFTPKKEAPKPYKRHRVLQKYFSPLVLQNFFIPALVMGDVTKPPHYRSYITDWSKGHLFFVICPLSFVIGQRTNDKGQMTNDK